MAVESSGCANASDQRPEPSLFQLGTQARIVRSLGVSCPGNSTSSCRANPEALLLRIPEVAERLGLSRTSVYKLINSGHLPSVSIGRARRIPTSAVEEYVTARVMQCACRGDYREDDDHDEPRVVRRPL